MHKKQESTEISQCENEKDTLKSNDYESAKVVSGKKSGFLDGVKILLVVILSVLLIISLLASVLFIFMDAISDNIDIPGIGSVSGKTLTSFISLWWLLVVISALIILLIAFLNAHRVRRTFLAVGISAIISAIVSIAAVLFRAQILRLLPGKWREVLMNTSFLFESFGEVCELLFIAIGITCLSIYFCITIVKRSKYEKSN